jgi:hypothetical protein
MRVKIDLEYEGKEYSVTEDYYGLDEESFMFYLKEGIMSNDCYRSLLIKRNVDETFPQLKYNQPGENLIKLLNIVIL